MTPKERFLAAAHCQPVDRPPVWLMRQAGRYLPEYRALKAEHDFLTLVGTPELAAEVTLQPLRRFALDAAVIFSDILVIPEALGQKYHFRDAGGIGMDYLLDSPFRIEALDGGGIPEKLSYVGDAIARTRELLGSDTAILGFAGTPWTLACYMVEGGSARTFTEIKKLAWNSPELFDALMTRLSDAITEFLHLQIDAGADAVQLFDSWAALCPARQYHAWSLRWVERIIQGLKGRVPVIAYAKGAGHHANALAQTGASILSLDWTVNLREIRKRLGPNVAVQGNLDPAVLTTSPEITRQETRRVLEEAGTEPGYIFNLGHGMLPGARIDCTHALVETVTG
ncbi:MAG: uroporphyrinogen decarboxylase [Opitutales bacterium]